jgi:hypothetical protein
MQLPIVPIGIGVDRPLRARTWDRFAIPRPGSRARAITGPEILIPPGLDRGELELRRQGVERLLNDLGDEAEAWAVSGEQRVGSIPIFRQGLYLPPCEIEESTRKIADVQPIEGGTSAKRLMRRAG